MIIYITVKKDCKLKSIILRLLRNPGYNHSYRSNAKTGRFPIRNQHANEGIGKDYGKYLNY